VQGNFLFILYSFVNICCFSTTHNYINNGYR